MLSSMTGYGRSVREADGRRITVEIKAVNHRFFECSVRTPRVLAFLEDSMRARAAEKIKRGKCEISLQMENPGGEAGVLRANEALVRDYIEALKKLGRTYGLKNNLKLSDLAANRDLFTFEKPQEDFEAIGREVMAALDEALEAFLAARAREGERLVADLLRRLDGIGAYVDEIDARSPETVREYSEKLLARVREAIGSATVDEARILTEAAIYADKVTVAEETTRLRTHIDHFRSLLQGQGPIGKKLDFYMQEMNRETNTIGSKCCDVAMTKIVVEVKSELENIREQIQNIE